MVAIFFKKNVIVQIYSARFTAEDIFIATDLGWKNCVCSFLKKN